MPLTHVSLRRGKPAEYRKAILDSLYRALIESFDVPQGDRFMTISEHDAENFDYGTFPGIARSDDLVFIQITANNTRTVEQKKTLFHRIAELLSENPGLRPEDLFINLVEIPPENWSMALGRLGSRW
jgi:phenylpyruvate tautomerase PptA (4-oxalocrotonate tautomerase family)